MKDDFQNRLAGTAIAIFALMAIVALAALVNEACKAADSGPIHSPSEWRR